MWKIILNFLKSDFVQKILLLSIIGILFVILFKQCSNNEALRWLGEQNQRALMDSVKVVNDKVGNLSWEKTAFAKSLKEMELLNKQLYDEAKEINGKVKTLQNVNAQFIVEELRKALISGQTISKSDSVDYYSFLWNENYSRGSVKSFLEGYTTVKHQKLPKDTVDWIDVGITKQQFALSLKTYIIENKDGFLVGGVAPLSPTPGLSFNIETGIFDPLTSKKYLSAIKPKNFVVSAGLYGGFGFGGIWYDDPLKYSRGPGWSIGLGVSLGYKLFSF